MSDPWDDVGVHLGGTREFLVNVEVFVTGNTTLRKPHNAKRKSDKRDNVKQSTGVLEDKRVKEKASWLSFPKDPTAEGHWRAATCKLTEEGERAILNVYVDESILYQSIFIHLLHHSDIRHAHPSLFQRKNCLAVHCVAGKRRSSPNMDEPIHLHFASTDLCYTWLSLLRSYALPEVYGRWISTEEGGSYRMWRQVELTVIQGRNLGNIKLFDGASDNMDESDSTSGPDPVDLDVTCDIQLNEVTCGRTTIKKGVGSPDWHESFVFSDLPPFDNLDVVVWRVKKLFKSSRLGRIRIALSNFPRGEATEGWFPVLKSESTLGDLHVGDVRLKLRVDEELILPFSAYDRLLKKLRSRNFLDWMTDLETKLKLKTVSTQLMSIAVADNTLIEQVSAVADREVDGSVSSHQTLFRGNNNLTRIAEQTMAWYGMDFLESSIGNVLRRLVAEKVCIEVDPMRSGKSPKDIERNVETLVTWCKRIWGQIFAARQSCPPPLTLEALVNITNPTPYAAIVPYVNIHILKDGVVLGSATAENLNVVRGNNTNLLVTAKWDPTADGEAGRRIASDLISEYLSGRNVTIDVKTHRGTIPTVPLIGEALSKLNITIAAPKLDIPGDGQKKGHFIRDATFHVLSSTATFTLVSPLVYNTIFVDWVNATAFYNHTEPVGHILYNLPFAAPPGTSTTPRLPVNWSMGSVGYDAVKKAIGGALKLDASANVTVRVGNWRETVWYEGQGIGATIRL